METKVKSGREILDDFFAHISEIEHVDKEIAQSLSNLYGKGNLTDANVKNELQRLRDRNER
jgi:hypothetical protein